MISLEFTGILNEHKGVEEGASLAREIERERRQREKGAAHRARAGEEHWVEVAGARPETVNAGEQRAEGGR